MKSMVQAWQFRKSHPDAQYSAALFCYEREFAIKFKSYCTFVSIDNNQRAKVGEPGFQVASAERGRCVIVGLNSSMEVGDHDFTGFSVVAFIVDIPILLRNHGIVVKLVGIKESAF